MKELNPSKNKLFDILNLSSKDVDNYSTKITYIKLEPGEKLNNFEEEIPGVLYIEEGEVRLLGLNYKDEPYTIEKFTEKNFIGIETILRGCEGQSIAASTNVKGVLIAKDIFLKLIEQDKKIYKSFRSLTLNELFSTVSLNKDAKSLNFVQLFNWCNEQLKNKSFVDIFFNGENLTSESSKSWLVSSFNVEGFPAGSIIKSPHKLKTKDKLPGRFIPLPASWPPNKEGSNKNRDEKLAIMKKYKKFDSYSIKRQKDSLEDRYGKLNNYILYPHSNGKGPLNESLACIRMLCQKFDLPFRKDLLKRVISDLLNHSKNKIENLQIASVCELVGLRCSILSPETPQLIERIPTPSLTCVKGHPIILWQQKNGKILISDPRNGQNWINTYEIFDKENNKNISILFLEKNSNSPKSRFGLRWFLPSLKKHKTSLFQVVIASFFVQILGLFSPLLIQQIIDAVITQGNLRSLNVLGILLITMAIAQAVIGSLRTYLFADTTNRMDISLGGSIINHLLRLPLEYFSKRSIGEVSSRINELEKIRNFLTSTALTAFLDSIFSFIYIGVMLTYSPKLTFFSLAVIPLFMLLSAIVSPMIRNHLREKAESNAKVSSHLVETIAGIETVKSQGMELQSEWRWERFYGKQIKASFRNTITSTAAGSASNFLQQVSGLIVIWAGALIVLDGKMTLGQLIAFRILSNYVTGPLLRITSLWQNFQETLISLERLSDIVDHKKETEIAENNLPPISPIEGKINYQNVSFRFNNKGPLQLFNINCEIGKGNFVGIVGSSGSGKSTLLKLLNRLFDPIEGTIYIDGQDISKIDLYSLRSQIGLVPQDCFLFDGTIQDNIALTNPEASIEEIKNAAKISCAHDFIEEMPLGYGTSVGERGSNLSGGQRQRIAIARMILKEPNLLILDEATSALDIDTEKKVIQQLADYFRAKTVLFISHRLSSLTFSDQILVLHQGVLVEQGKHNDLMNLNGRYATLFHQQGLSEK